MKYYVITDTHLGHHKMHTFCGRPDGFEGIILRNLGNSVGQEDVLIHLGDVCIYQEEYWNRVFRHHCRGKMWLVKGNHDKKSDSWYIDKGWDMVCTSLLLTRHGKRILFSHKPSEFVDQCDVNIHGHHHNTAHHPEDGLSVSKHHLVYIEHSYTPVNLSTIIGGRL